MFQKESKVRQSRIEIAVLPDTSPPHRIIMNPRRDHQSSLAKQVRIPHVAAINRFSFDTVHRVLGGVFEQDGSVREPLRLTNMTIGPLSPRRPRAHT